MGSSPQADLSERAGPFRSGIIMSVADQLIVSVKNVLLLDDWSCNSSSFDERDILQH